MKADFLNGRVYVVVGDITREKTDAIVNAANSSLMGGGGVDGAIHRAGGPAILEECRRLRRERYPDGLPPGEAVATSAGNLPAKYVIHTVGPVYGKNEGREAEILASCYRNSLRVAAGLGLRSIAFPAISTGAYGYPPSKAAAVASRAIAESLDELPLIREVRLVFFQAEDAEIFIKHQVFTKGKKR